MNARAWFDQTSFHSNADREAARMAMTDEELVKLAAEKVMGWRVHIRNTAHWVLADQERGTYDMPQAGVRDWNPLRHDTEAMMLVDKLHEHEMAFVLGSNGYADQWSAWFIRGIWSVARMQNAVPSDENLLGSATSSNRRRAIVLAALKALGVEVPA